MSRDKQIEEMVKVTMKHCKIDNQCGSCHWSTCNECLADVLYNAGYRKASEVVEYAIKKLVGLIKIYEYYPIVTPKGMIEQKIVDIDDIERSADEVVAELKKKYTEGKDV